jgi:hypothetical protein
MAYVFKRGKISYPLLACHLLTHLHLQMGTIPLLHVTRRANTVFTSRRKERVQFDKVCSLVFIKCYSCSALGDRSRLG